MQANRQKLDAGWSLTLAKQHLEQARGSVAALMACAPPHMLAAVDAALQGVACANKHIDDMLADLQAQIAVGRASASARAEGYQEAMREVHAPLHDAHVTAWQAQQFGAPGAQQ